MTKLLILVFIYFFISSCSGGFGSFRSERFSPVSGFSSKRTKTDLAVQNGDFGQHENLELDSDKGISSTHKASVTPFFSKEFKQKGRSTRDDFIDSTEEEGSLWASSGQTNYYFTRNKIRSQGDLISLVVEDSLLKDVFSEIKKTLNSTEKNREINHLEDMVKAQIINSNLNSTQKNLDLSANPSPEKTTTKNPFLPEELARLSNRISFEDIDLSRSIEFKSKDMMMGEILERFPNGNYRVRTRRKIPYKNGSSRVVSIVGIIKNGDLSEDSDTINSGRLYDYRIEVSI